MIRVKAASGDKSREKLNKSRGGGGGANVSPRCISMKTYSFCQFLFAFMIMMRSDIDYDGKYVVAF